MESPDYARLAERQDVDSLAIAYLQAPNSDLRTRIVELGGAQATNAITRIRLAAAGLCQPGRAPKLPARFLADWGGRVSAWTRLTLAEALLQTPPPIASSELEAPGAAWPEVTGSWGLTSLMSRFGASSAINDTKDWVTEHKAGPPLAAPFDRLDRALCSIAANGVPKYSGLPATGLAVRAKFHSTEATAAGAAASRDKSTLAWLAGRQSTNGGWAQFDKDQSMDALRTTPLANVQGAADVPCPGVTGRVVEWLVAAGSDAAGSPSIRSAVKFLIDAQQADGSWRSVWGRGAINGTYSALAGFAAAGESDREAHVLRGGEWLRSIQNADGGWGEDLLTARVLPSSNPTQTAWAVLGLIAGGDVTSSSLDAAVEYLLATQNGNGTWTDRSATAGGPGFEFAPNQFYPAVYVTMALSRYVEVVLNHG